MKSLTIGARVKGQVNEGQVCVQTISIGLSV